MPTTPATSPLRPTLGILTAIPKAFDLKDGATMESPELFLVNETTAKERNLPPEVFKDWTRDELIVLIAKSLGEFGSLVKELHEYKIVQANAAEAIEKAFFIVVGRHYDSVKDGDPMTAIQSNVSRFRQAEDVISNIANNVPIMEAKNVAQKFIANFRPVTVPQDKMGN